MDLSPNNVKHVRSSAWCFWTKLAAALLFLFVALLFLSPRFHDIYFGVAKNESSAVSSLRKITALEAQYAAAHPKKGFACQLRLVRPTGEKTNGRYDPTEALLAGEWSGYKFAVTDCIAQANGIVTTYQATAVPASPGRSGIRAFCTDQTGELFYDADASASKCSALRKPIF
jgi:hypothetical protein